MRQCRIDAGLTIAQLSDLAGIEYTTIYSWETGANQPRLKKLITVCDVLGITLDEYVGHRVTDGITG